MKLHEFLPPVSQAVGRVGPNDWVVLSTRVRLARNLRGNFFPDRAKKNDRVRVCSIIRKEVEALPQMADGFAESMETLSAVEKQTLVERHLVSREHAMRGAGSAIVLSKDTSLSVMINEEDHLRMQSLKPGMQLQEAWVAIDEVDTALSKTLDFAFSDEFGYLTACPTNVGTGIRVSAMLHLPGLVLAEQINRVIQAANELGLAVRGLYGEGTEALGNLFQVSNQRTLGQTEEEIIERVRKVVNNIIENEKNARGLLLQNNPKMVYNHIGRAYGILANSHSISSKETMNLLSLFRLGFDLGFFPGVQRSFIDELFMVTQPAHLQARFAGKLSAEERDIRRADMLREAFRNVERPSMPSDPTSSLDKT